MTFCHAGKISSTHRALRSPRSSPASQPVPPLSSGSLSTLSMGLERRLSFQWTEFYRKTLREDTRIQTLQQRSPHSDGCFSLDLLVRFSVVVPALGSDLRGLG